MDNLSDYYEDLAEMANSIILLMSPAGTIQYINKYGADFFRFRRSELLGANIVGTIVPETDSSGRKQSRLMRRICKEPDKYVKNVNENVLKSGQRVWIAWTNKGIEDDNGRTYQILCVGNDITTEKKFEKRLTKIRKELEVRVHERTGKLNQVYEELKALTRRLAMAEEAQKKRISRDIHDQIGQNLSTIGLNLNFLRSIMSKDSERSVQLIAESLSLLRDTTHRVRYILEELRLPVLDDYGLLAALRWYSDQYTEKTGIKLVVDGNDLSPRPDAHIESSLFLIAREALTNVAKHSRASRVGIRVDVKNNVLFLSVKDNGMGYSPDGKREQNRREGMGLLSMSERAVLIGGLCRMKSSPGKGTFISVEVPL